MLKIEKLFLNLLYHIKSLAGILPANYKGGEMMLKRLLILTLVIFTLVGTLFSAEPQFVLSLVPQHKEGLFVEFTAIGFSFGNMEISTQPLLDVLGLFNLRLRSYLSPMFVFSTETYLFDPFFISKAYAGEPYNESTQIYVLFNRSYLHSNLILGPIIVKPYGELLTVLIGNHNFSEYGGSTIARGFLSAGILLTRNVEIFGTVESGLAFNVWKSEELNKEEWEQFIQELREKTLYASIRAGLTWYYDNYSGLEIGYRMLIYGKDSPLRLIQGFTLTDYIYNIYSAIQYSGEEGQVINIPFITTDYYLSFSTKF